MYAHSSDNHVTIVPSTDLAKRLDALQAHLQALGVDAFLQPTGDAFQSEYSPESARRLHYISGFSGSAGTGLFLSRRQNDKDAVLFTDGRYTLQAQQELDAERFWLINSGECPPAKWLSEQMPKAIIGFDPWLHTAAQISRIRADVPRELTLKPLEYNPVDAIWQERPAEPISEVHRHPLNYAGESSQSKRERLAFALKDKGVDAVFLAQPDGINWLLNIRGSDIPFNPLILCFAVLEASGRVRLIMHPRDCEIDALGQDVEMVNLQEFMANPVGLLSDYETLQLDPASTAYAITHALAQSTVEVSHAADPVLHAKACKNAIEIEGMRACHQRDGRAVTKFLQWLDEALPRHAITELQAVRKLERFRAEESGEYYRGPSFDTISGSGPNGAIVHYRVTEESDREIGENELYLVDSGGQYPDGTTDITRTIINGKPTTEMIDRYTRVLKGHIALATAVFPAGTTGSQLDILARKPLWAAGLDYDHGTGHGVGSHLCVHEGPQRISKRVGDTPLQPGMILSNEPGYYKTGEYGIRIENLVLVIDAKTPGFYTFETLTLVPIDMRLVDDLMINALERMWLEDYHIRVEENLSKK